MNGELPCGSAGPRTDEHVVVTIAVNIAGSADFTSRVIKRCDAEHRESIRAVECRDLDSGREGALCLAKDDISRSTAIPPAGPSTLTASIKTSARPSPLTSPAPANE